MKRLIASIWVASLVSLTLVGSAAADAGDYGIESFSASLTSNEAGAHPDFTTTFGLKRDPETNLIFAPTREIAIDLPPGLSGNPNAATRCTAADLALTEPNNPSNENSCPVDSQVGVSEVTVYNGGGLRTFLEPLYNMEPGPESVARLGFVAEVFPTFVDVGVRSEGDYGIRATVRGAGSFIPLLSATTTIWGVPADASHNAQRITPYEALHCSGEPCTTPGEEPRSSGLKPAPYFTNPTRCGAPLEVGITARSYALPDQPSSLTDPLPSMVGCGKLGFDPSFSAAPTSRQAASPTGLDANLTIPQDESVKGRATSQLRYARVELPRGVTIASGGGDGLEACSAAQVGFGANEASHCPDRAKIAAVEVEAPALSRTLHGAVYQRTPVKGDLFGFWLVADELGMHIKLPGVVHADPQTGQLSAVVEGTPQTDGLPQVTVEAFRLHFKGGARAVLAAPQDCGTYQTEYEFGPWSGGAPVKGTTAMTFDQGCDTGGFDPKLVAGSTEPVAGAFAPFVVDLIRQSSEQNIAGVTVRLPLGVTAKLAGVPTCEGPAAVTGHCPAASLIGKVAVSAGPGPSPLWIPRPGKDPTAVYLGGPYRGAPLSAVVRVPAQVGPFDLGTVVNRVAIDVDPSTAQVTASSDPLPQFLEGVPISYRTLHVSVDKSGFALNPTGCEAKRVSARVISSQGASASPTSRFRVGGCRGLGFKPKLSLNLKGPINRGGFPALRAVYRPRKGDANVSSLRVTLPRSAFVEQAHFRTVCTRVQFADGLCPPGSIYGHVKAFTPLLDAPLEGPIYLRSSNHQLPDLVFALRGMINLDLVGRVDSIRGRLRTRFESAPDAPISKVVVEMRGGPKSLIVNSTNLCSGKHSATGVFVAHNGKHRTLRPPTNIDCLAEHRPSRHAR